MPLVGGGGAGNVAGGSNPAGTGTSLNYVRFKDKTLAYAYSGAIAVPTGGATMLAFETMNEAIIGHIQYNIGEDTGNNFRCDVILNGQTNISYVIALDNREATNVLYIVIPPYTKVEIKGTNLSSGANDCFLSLSGEVYA